RLQSPDPRPLGLEALRAGHRRGVDRDCVPHVHLDDARRSEDLRPGWLRRGQDLGRELSLRLASLGYPSRAIQRDFWGIQVRQKLPAPVLVTLFVALAVAASAPARPVAHQERESRAQVLRYWTAERMQEAQPAGSPVRPNAAGNKGGKGGKTTFVASTEVPQP